MSSHYIYNVFETATDKLSYSRLWTPAQAEEMDKASSFFYVKAAAADVLLAVGENYAFADDPSLLRIMAYNGERVEYSTTLDTDKRHNISALDFKESVRVGMLIKL